MVKQSDVGADQSHVIDNHGIISPPPLDNHHSSSSTAAAPTTTITSPACTHPLSTTSSLSPMHVVHQSKPRHVTAFSAAYPRIDLIFNEVSGQRDPAHDLHTITDILSQSFALVRVWKTRPTYSGADAARDALGHGANVLIACGGDGTVAQVAETLKRLNLNDDHHVYLGVIPRGTANALCTALHIPTNVTEAAAMIATGVRRTIDFPSVVSVNRTPAPMGDNVSDKTHSVPEPTSSSLSTALPASIIERDDVNNNHNNCTSTTATSTVNPLSSVNTTSDKNADTVRDAPIPVNTPLLSPQSELSTYDDNSTKAISHHHPAGTTITNTTTTTATKTPSPRSMLLLCGIGLEALTVRKASRRLKRAIGAAAYAIAGLRTVCGQASFDTRLTVQGINISDLPFTHTNIESDGVTTFEHMELQGVTIANVAPPASVLAQGVSGGVIPDDGLLEIVCIASMHPLGLVGTMFSLLWAAVSGSPVRHVNNVFGLRARKVRVECSPPQPIVIDGEPVGFTPIEIELDQQVSSPPVTTSHRHDDDDDVHDDGDGVTRNSRHPQQQGRHCVTVIAPSAQTVSRKNKHASRGIIRMFKNIRGFAVFALFMSVVSKKRAANR